MLLPKYDFSFRGKVRVGNILRHLICKFSVKLYRVQEIIYASDPKNIISSVSFTLTNATAQTG